jgi:hypothetical protein
MYDRSTVVVNSNLFLLCREITPWRIDACRTVSLGFYTGLQQQLDGVRAVAVCRPGHRHKKQSVVELGHKNGGRHYVALSSTPSCQALLYA